jgi:hypothetical protein
MKNNPPGMDCWTFPVKFAGMFDWKQFPQVNKQTGSMSVEFFPDASLFSDQQTFTSQSQGRPEPFST